MADLLTSCTGLTPVIDELMSVAGFLWHKGWAEVNAGNLSVDVTDLVDERQACAISGKSVALPQSYPELAGRYFLVTGSGRRFRDVAVNAAEGSCILRISEGGNEYRLVWGGEAGPLFRPTSELPSHLRLHQDIRKNDAPERAVLHTHPLELIALTHVPEYKNEAAMNEAIWSVHCEMKVMLPKGVGLVPYTVPGSEALALATLAGFQRGFPVVLWEMHGAVAKAKSAMEAFDLIDIANKAASLLLMCRSAGVVPKGLSKEQQAELVSAFGLEDKI